MTKDEFLRVTAGLPIPFWVVTRNGDQLLCSKIAAIADDRISMASDDLARVVYFADVQSVMLTLQIGSMAPLEPFAPVLAAEQ